MKGIANSKVWKPSVGFVGGKWTTKPSTFDVINPATGSIVATAPRFAAVDAIDAAKVAHEAWGKWKSTLVADRAKYLRRMSDLMNKYADDLALIITIEAGKPMAESKGEVAYAKSFLDLYAEEATRVRGEMMQTTFHNQKMMTIRQPVGPAVLITPWNFPSAMVTRKLGPALAAGCTVVIKPSEETPMSAMALCAIAEEAGIPPGVVNCLPVGREEVQEVGLAFCHSRLIRKLSFTGKFAAPIPSRRYRALLLLTCRQA